MRTLLALTTALIPPAALASGLERTANFPINTGRSVNAVLISNSNRIAGCLENVTAEAAKKCPTACQINIPNKPLNPYDTCEPRTWSCQWPTQEVTVSGTQACPTTITSDTNVFKPLTVDGKTVKSYTPWGAPYPNVWTTLLNDNTYAYAHCPPSYITQIGANWWGVKEAVCGDASWSGTMGGTTKIYEVQDCGARAVDTGRTVTDTTVDCTRTRSVSVTEPCPQDVLGGGWQGTWTYEKKITETLNTDLITTTPISYTSGTISAVNCTRPTTRTLQMPCTAGSPYETQACVITSSVAATVTGTTTTYHSGCTATPIYPFGSTAVTTVTETLVLNPMWSIYKAYYNDTQLAVFLVKWSAVRPPSTDPTLPTPTEPVTNQCPPTTTDNWWYTYDNYDEYCAVNCAGDGSGIGGSDGGDGYSGDVGGDAGDGDGDGGDGW